MGILWSLFISDTDRQFRIATCFLSFVAIAGIVASVTIEPGTGLPQTVPAVMALALLLASPARSRR